MSKQLVAACCRQLLPALIFASRRGFASAPLKANSTTFEKYQSHAMTVKSFRVFFDDSKLFWCDAEKIIVCSFAQREFSKAAALKPAKVVKLVKGVWAGNFHLHHLYRLSAGQFRKPSARLVAELRAIDQLPSSRGRVF